MIRAEDGAAAIDALKIAPRTHPAANRRRGVIASARLVTAVRSVPTTNPPCTAIVSHARVPTSIRYSPAIAGAAAVAENHNVMPRTSPRAMSVSIRHGWDLIAGNGRLLSDLRQGNGLRPRFERQHGDLGRQLLGGRAERLGGGRLRLADDDRHARVSADTNRFVDRNPPQKRHVHVC